MPQPQDFPRRSFVYHRLVQAGAEFVTVGDSAVAERFPGDEEADDADLGLIDLSPLPRSAYRGPRALAWLRLQGLQIPRSNNSALRQDQGALLARLSDSEGLVLDNPLAAGELITRLAATPVINGVYQTARRDSHGWFYLRGGQAATCMAKLCALDLRPERFPDLAVAQISVAAVSCIVLHEDRGGVPGYHLLADSACTVYLWDCLLDAMAEFHGRPIGRARLAD